MFKRILVPLEGSKLAEKALPYTKAMAAKFKAELILVLERFFNKEVV
jgi:nucleotide-binding universal stress UspA family protein